ncbi:hypothetical protein [Leptospira saintgironsiae]|uniref:Uncharacterized protein n=1 Tax=Leptospira saintgironsiae TaxID=2023183 RepID=A0A2M9Y7H0_9LEPT|nr:hypothetical protein [Leptospira saintgironsiae]PJZ47459.1 hypothetical protein CH362_19110 [Leptospira saintgironsiae]
MKVILANKLIRFLFLMLVLLIMYVYVYPISCALLDYKSELEELNKQNDYKLIADDQIIRINNSNATFSLNKLNLNKQLKCQQFGEYHSFCIAPESVESSYGIKTLSLEQAVHCADVFRLSMHLSDIPCKDMIFDVLAVKPIKFGIFDDYRIIRKELFKLGLRTSIVTPDTIDEFIILTENETYYVFKTSKNNDYQIFAYWDRDYVYKIETVISDKDILIESLKKIKI